jgi:hypothetical protein
VVKWLRSTYGTLEQIAAAVEASPVSATISTYGVERNRLRRHHSPTLAPDWPSRVADYQAFTSSELRDYAKGSGIHVMGYRVLRDLMRAAR